MVVVVVVVVLPAALKGACVDLFHLTYRINSANTPPLPFPGVQSPTSSPQVAAKKGLFKNACVFEQAMWLYILYT